MESFCFFQIVEPENEVVVLAIGSSKQIVFEGGPRPLLEKPSGWGKLLEVENGTVASTRERRAAPNATPPDDLYVFEVLCKELGETDAIFKIGNFKTSTTSVSI